MSQSGGSEVLRAELEELREAAAAVLESAMVTFNGKIEVSEESLAKLETVLGGGW